jgi:aquaporin TIP
MAATPNLGRRFAAELAGTFIFVFVGAGSAFAGEELGLTDPASALLIAAFANGVGLAIAISITMAVSGGALNPAVTIGLWVGKKLPGRDVIPYIIAEVVGATLAALVLAVATPSGFANVVNYGGPALGSGVTYAQAIVLEMVATFALVMAVYGTIVDERAPKIAGLGVGFMVLTDVLAIGPFTGAAMNPARAIGPMIAGLSSPSYVFPTYWFVYWVGPILGAIIASLFYHYVLESHKKSVTPS